MPDRYYEFDPEGDVMFVFEDVPKSLPYRLGEINASFLSGIYDRKQSYPTSMSSEVAINRTPTTNLVQAVKSALSPSLHIRTSSKHLMLASPHFKRTFQKGFQEGNELQSTGYVKITTHDWKPLPFLLLMAILHGQSQLVPRKLPLRRLTEMAILVDYYECYEAVAMFADLWTEGIEERQQKLSMGNAIKWLCVSWVFRQNRAFKDITRHLQLESKERVTPNGLPIPTNLIDTLQKSREMSIGKVIDSLHELLERLRHGPQQCGFGCDIMRLGALAKGMDELEILSPKPEAPFSGYSFMSLMAGCYEIDKSYTYDSCRLMSDVLEMVGNEFPLLDAGFGLESFSSLRTKP